MLYCSDRECPSTGFQLIIRVQIKTLPMLPVLVTSGPHHQMPCPWPQLETCKQRHAGSILFSMGSSADTFVRRSCVIRSDYACLE